MNVYKPEGLAAFRAYATAAAEEHAIAHELAQCAKLDVYELLAVDLFGRVMAARAKCAAAFAMIEQYKS